MFPALSYVYTVTVVVPSAVILNVPPLVIVVSLFVVPPLNAYVTLFTPDSLSVPAVTFTVIFDLYHPLLPAVPPDTVAFAWLGAVLSIFVTSFVTCSPSLNSSSTILASILQFLSTVNSAV